MLILSRRLNEEIVFPGLRTAVRVVAVKGGEVRLGVEAPPEVTVLRGEVEDRAGQWRPSPARSAGGAGLAGPLKAACVGLGLARLQLQAGDLCAVDALLDRLHDEIQSLRRRLEGKEATPQAGTGPHAVGECEQLAGCLG
jgi:carbon storage regulator